MIQYKINWGGKQGFWYHLSVNTIEEARDAINGFFERDPEQVLHTTWEVREVPDNDVPT